MRDSDYELEHIFQHFEKLVEKERKRRTRRERKQEESSEKGKKEDGRYIRHDRD